LRFTALLFTCAALLSPQGLTTNATKDEWEEINFEFASSILSDGYPSLLRLSELLQQNPDYRVVLDGHTDWVGPNRVNDKLATARAQTVRNFLVKYGANPSQITVAGHGKKQPEVSNRSREGRFMNRRVTLTVTDGQGKVVSAGGINEAIKAVQASEASEQQRRKCCDEVLKRLDKLDEILAALKDLKAENDKLKQDVAALKQAETGVEKQVAELPRAPEKAELQKMMDTTANNAVQKAKPDRFSLLGMNLGPALSQEGAPGQIGAHGVGSVTFTGKGQYFAPFGKDESTALQADAEYMYYRDRQEGQFDVGLVNRWSHVQAGLFSSIKHVELTGLGGGTLGQAAFTTDLLFPGWRIGLFGTKSYLTDPVIARSPTQIGGTASQPLFDYNVLTETYLRVVDQFGMSTQVGLWSNAYAEGNFGALFRSGGPDRPGGTIRLVQPISPRLAATFEASLNETMVGAKNNGRVALGIEFGNWIKPKDFMTVKYPVPVDVPRVRYEVLTRQVRTGHALPIANAGPDQIGVPAGTITLDASASYSPEGLPLTFQWTQISGASVTLASPTSAKTTFTATAGQAYQFRVTVTDSLGGQASATTRVTTKSSQVRGGVQIVSFQANPAVINRGQSSTLQWQTQNATSVTISGVGTVAQNGSTSVSPAQTTTYTLTASNSSGQVSASVTVTVTVSGAGVSIGGFSASPSTITAGQSSLLAWTTQGASSASISGVGSVPVNGSVSVSPTQTTTYTLTATGAGGSTATKQVTVTVKPAPVGPSGPPVVVIAGGPHLYTQGFAITLDASGSTSPGGGTLTYRWTGPGNTIILNPNSAATLVSAQDFALGDYTFTVTVTNNKGQSSTGSVTVTFLAPPSGQKP
jgi:hypothetical protein